MCVFVLEIGTIDFILGVVTSVYLVVIRDQTMTEVISTVRLCLIEQKCFAFFWGTGNLYGNDKIVLCTGNRVLFFSG